MTKRTCVVVGVAAMLTAACGGVDSTMLDAGAGDGGVSAPVVTIASGTVRGIDRGGVHQFWGIPYAAAPIGDLRFRAPEAPAAWTEPLDASAPRAYCPQPANAVLPSRGAETEDCLQLNVFTPDLDPGASLPVMVFVHGGAFTIGTATSLLYDGSHLAALDVVVVTINYRLGLAGFLAHPALGAEAGGSSGMYGLLDQQAALRWVRDNAASFGGDPSRVTLFGESAGSMSVCAHYFSPGSRGLFARAISESGSCVTAGPSALTIPDGATASANGLELAAALGCPGADAAAAACLRALPADMLVDAIPIGAEGAGTYGLLSIAPSVDGTVLPEHPTALLASGAHARVPYVMGTNRDEGTLFTDDALITTVAAYDAAVRGYFGSESDEVLALYPLADYATPLAALDAIIRDVGFVCPTRALARGLSTAGVDVRVYQVVQTNATTDAMGLGATHAIELLYVFGNFTFPFGRASAAEERVRDAMQGYWTRFAATGDPDGAGLAWPRYDTTEPHIVLGDPLSTGSALERARCEALAAITPG